MKAVIITTEYRGVFFGYVEDDTDLTKTTLGLKNARMAIRWQTTKGIAELAKEGPNGDSIIGDVADWPVIHKVTGVIFVTQKAEIKWMEA
mgnify:CR=1 FL=1